MAEVGRPTELTDDVIRKIEEVAALDGTIEEMAFYANVHRATIYRWLKEDSEFSDKINALRQRPVLKARQTVVKSLDDPNYAFKYLEKKRKKEFGNSIDMTTKGDKINSISDQAKDELYKTLSIQGLIEPSECNGQTSSTVKTLDGKPDEPASKPLD